MVRVRFCSWSWYSLCICLYWCVIAVVMVFSFSFSSSRSFQRQRTLSRSQFSPAFILSAFSCSSTRCFWSVCVLEFSNSTLSGASSSPASTLLQPYLSSSLSWVASVIQYRTQSPINLSIQSWYSTSCLQSPHQNPMTECLEHQQQFTSIFPSLSIPVCPQCPQYFVDETPFGASLPLLKSAIINLQQFVLSEMVMVNIHDIKEMARTELGNTGGDEDEKENDTIFRDIDNLSSLQSQFWQFPQAQLISGDSKSINWKVLVQYQVINQAVVVENIISIKEFLIKHLEEMKVLGKNIETRIQEKVKRRREKYRVSQIREMRADKFELVIEDVSSGEEADDLQPIDVPDGVGLEESYRDVVKLIEKKKIGLSIHQEAPETNGGEQVSQPLGQSPVSNMKKQKNLRRQPEPENKQDEGQSPNKQQIEKVENIADENQQKKKSEPQSVEEVGSEREMELIMNLEDAIKNNQLQRALDVIERILEISPSNIGVLQAKAKILRVNKDKEKSFDIYKSLLQSSECDTSVIYEAATIHLQRKNYPQAKALIDRLFQSQPLKPEYYCLKGDYLLKYHSKQRIFYERVVDKPKQILECYNAAYNFPEKDKKYIFRVAVYHINQKEYEQAYEIVKVALKKDPNNLNYLKTQAWLSFKIKHYTQSATLYEEISRQQATFQILNNYAISLYFNSQSQLSKQKILESLKMAPNESAVILNALTILRAVWEYRQGFNIVQRSFGLLKSNELFISKACEIAIHLKSYEEGVSLLDQITTVRKMNINNTKQFYIAYFTLGLFLKKEDVIADGLQTLKKFLGPQISQNQKREVWNTLGMLKVFQGETGLEQFRKAISCCHEKQPKHAHFWNCSVAAYKTKLYKESLQLIEKAIALEKKGVKSKYFEFRVCVLIKQYDFESSLNRLEEFRRDFPSQVDQHTYARLKGSLLKIINE